MIGFGNAGGIIATFTFLAKDAPFYHTGYSICVGAMCICVSAVVVYAGLAWRENKAIKAAGEGEKKSTYYSM